MFCSIIRPERETYQLLCLCFALLLDQKERHINSFVYVLLYYLTRKRDTSTPLFMFCSIIRPERETHQLLCLCPELFIFSTPQALPKDKLLHRNNGNTFDENWPDREIER
jgi:hypothetical protein